MKLIIDFYRGLDTINLILFWGIILVIFLLLIFAIIITNKNKRLKKILYTKEQEIEETKNELAIKQEIIDEKQEIIINKEKTKIEKNNIINQALPNSKQEENQQIQNIYVTHTTKAEIEPPKQDITINVSTDNSKEDRKKEEEIIINKEFESSPKKEEFIVEEYVKPEKEEITIPTGPYQKNVLRQMSLNQTSPIGITKKEPNPQKDILNAGFSKPTIENVEIIEEPSPIEYKNNYKEEMDNSKKMINKLYEEDKQTNKDNNYLKELSKKIEESNSNNDIKRTDYELKQEEDAIISYDELMQKKDTIKIDDEEDAIISIKELKDKERIYNITKDEENDEFISELKEFRSDL